MGMEDKFGLTQSIKFPYDETEDAEEVVDHSLAENIEDTSDLSDEDLARKAIRDLMTKQTEAINRLMDVAKDSEAARDYEVLGQMIKSTSEMAHELLKLQKTKKEADNIGKKIPAKTTNNLIFTGSLKELTRQLNDHQKQIEGGEEIVVESENIEKV